MAYKRIRVWDGTEWLQVGAQVPGVVDASGVGTVTLNGSGDGTVSVAFGAGVTFSVAPLVFVQVTGTNFADSRVIPDTVGFTVHFKGTASQVITFSWFAVQVDFA